MQLGRTIKEISMGEKATWSKTISESDVYAWVGIMGDFNPVHINVSYAEKTAFRQRIVPGLLTAGFISACLTMRIPGPGCIYVSQEVKFLAPVYVGDTITAELEVLQKDEEKNRLTLRTTCRNQHDVMVIDGNAIVSPPIRKTR
jgi:3-hydroxybutyryl-CoA dehydratase